MLTLRQIEAFRAVMMTGTVTEAAKVLEISQPAVSRMVSYLEHEVGFSLFNRANRQLIPTDEGRAFYDDVERAFTGLDRLKQSADAIREYRRGQIRLITIPSLAPNFIVDVVARFARAYPDIAVSLEVQPSQRVFEWIVSQECDLGLSTLPIRNPAVETQPVFHGHAVCALPKAHPLAAKRCIRPADLEGETFINFKVNSVFRQMVDEVFLKAGVRRDLRIEARTTEAICGLVAAGLGVSVIGPAFPLADERPGIAIRPFEPAITIELALLHSARRPLSLICRRFAEMLCGYVDETLGPQKNNASARR